MNCFPENVPKSIIRLIDTKTSKHFLFVGNYDETSSIITKINNEGKKSLSREDLTLLEKYYDTLIDSITDNTILIKAFIHPYDTIDTIGKKIMTFVDTSSIPTDMYIWSEDTSLYFKYNDSNGKRVSFATDITKSGFIPNKKLLTEGTLVDTRYSLLEEIIELKKIVTLNYISINNVDSELIQTIYFPFSKNKDSIYTDYPSLIKENVEIENKLYDIKLPEEYLFKSCNLRNTVLKNYHKNIDIHTIFNKLNMDSIVPFMRYKDNKEELYKLYVKTFSKKPFVDSFKDPQKYIIEYEPNYYNQDISQSTFEKWTQKEISFKEKNIKKKNKQLGIQTSDKKELIIKLKWEDNYFDIELTESYVLLRILSDSYYSIDVIENIIKKTNDILKPILKINAFSFRTIQFISCDTIDSINIPKTKLSDIQKLIKNYFNYFYKIEPEDSDKNKLYLKYKRVSDFESFENIKRHFIKLKTSNKQLSLNEFKEAWVIEARNLFNMVETDALSTLSRVTEIVSQEEMNKTQIDIDIDVVISRNFYDTDTEEDNYSLFINNCDNLVLMNTIKKIVSTLLFNSNKKNIKIVKKAPVESKIEVVQTAFKEEDDFDLDDDFIDLEDEDDEEEEEVPIETTQEQIDETSDDLTFYEDDDEEDDKNDFTMKKRSLRNYMSSLRNYDKKLFKYKSKGKYKSYSIKCGAVDMRQPIILTKSELKHFETKNPSAFKELTKLEWGSSVRSKHFYICPRIWCIRDKIALTDNQLIDNDGRCPFCQGEIIDPQAKEIEENKTIIIKKAGSNKYWANPNKQNSEKWKQYLEGTEETAYPSFLDPGLHPAGLCMPCCNKSKNWNYSKCMIADVTYATEDPVNEKDLKTGSPFQDIKLKKYDTILVKRKHDVFRVTDTGLERQPHLTKLMIPLQQGMILLIKAGKYKDSEYEVQYKKKDDKLVIVEKTTKIQIVDDKYIQGEDKIPLNNTKLGMLPSSLDSILDNNSLQKIFNSRIRDSSQLLVRKGTAQFPNHSFINAIASLNIKTKSNPVKLTMELIIKNLDPLTFLSLNNGDLYKMFSSTKTYLELDKKVYKIFLKWCKEHESFIDFLLQTHDSSSLNTIKEFINEKDTTKSVLKELKLSVNYKNIKLNPLTEFLFNVFYSFETFKMYCGDLNIYKEPIIFYDLLSRKHDWFFKKGLNILIFESKTIVGKEKVYLNCPLTEDIHNVISEDKPYLLLFKKGDVYEPIIYASVSETSKLSLTNILSSEKQLSAILMYKIKVLFKLIVNNCKVTLDKELDINYKTLPSLKSVYSKYNTSIIKLVCDTYFKGIGVLLESQHIIFTNPYDIDRIPDLPFIKLSDVPVLKYVDLLPLLEQKPQGIVINKDKVSAIILHNGSFHPIKNEEYDKETHTLPIKNINYIFPSLIGSTVSKQKIYSREAVIKQAFLDMIEKTDFESRRRLKKLIRLITENKAYTITQKRKLLFDLIKQIFNNTCKTVLIRFRNNLDAFKDIGDITINTESCVKEFSIKEYDIYRFVDIILNSYGYRIMLLEENQNSLDLSKHVIFADDYLNRLNTIFKVSQLYIKNPITKTLKNTEITKDTIEKITDEIKIDDISPSFNIEEAQKNITYPDLWGMVYDKRGINDTRDNVKEGQCIFPFKLDTNAPYNFECVETSFSNKNKICATEVDKEGTLIKYGYCRNNNEVCKSDIRATSIDDTNEDLSLTNNDVMGGPCCFPYKDGATGGLKEFDKCRKQTKKIHKGKTTGTICATSLTPSGRLKTWGFCPKTLKLKQKTNTVSVKVKNNKPKKTKLRIKPKMLNIKSNKKPISRITKDGKACLFPFKHGEDTTIHNDCILTKDGEICPTKLKEDRILPIKKTKDMKDGTSDISYGYCLETEPLDESKWKGPINNHYLYDKDYKKTGILPRVRSSDGKPLTFKTLKEALNACENNKLCKGVTEQINKTHTLTFHLNTTDILVKEKEGEPKHRSWIKK
jgi:hypothetical protein